jgi:ribosomal protein S6
MFTRKLAYPIDKLNSVSYIYYKGTTLNYGATYEEDI